MTTLHASEVSLARPACQQVRPRQRVWLVDDNERVSRLMAELLESVDGFDCSRQFCSAHNLLLALQRETPPNSILLDIQLGEENGVDFIQPIKALAPRTRIHMFTTFFDPEQAARARNAGAAGFLLKTDDLDRIVEHIRGAE